MINAVIHAVAGDDDLRLGQSQRILQPVKKIGTRERMLFFRRRPETVSLARPMLMLMFREFL